MPRPLGRSDTLFAAWLDQQLAVRQRSLSELAKEMGCSLATVSQVRKGGQRLTSDFIGKLAAALGLPPEEVRDGVGFPPEPAQRPQPVGAAFDPRWYVRRTDEEELALILLQNRGKPVVLWGPHLFGKTWFKQSLLQRLELTGEYQTVSLDAGSHSSQTLSVPENLMREWATIIMDATRLPDTAATRAMEEWHRWRTPYQNLTVLIEQHVLPRVSGILVFACDAADVFVGQPCQDDLFYMLRRWCVMAGKDPWSRFRLILPVSTHPNRLASSLHRSPFNLADTQTIPLLEFSDAQVRILLELYRIEISLSDLDALRGLVGGHPYLLRLALDAIVDGWTVADLVTEAIAPASPFGQHLNQMMQRLQRAGLAKSVLQLLQSSNTKLDDKDFHHLQRLGIVHGSRSSVTIRFPIYLNYLKHILGIP